MKIARKVLSVEACGNYFAVRTNAVTLRLYFLTEDILRIRAGFDGDFLERSYSLVMTAWDDLTDKLFGAERRRVKCVDAQLTFDNSEHSIIKGGHLTVIIDKEPFKLTVIDQDGTVIHADIVDLAYQEDSNHRRIHTSEISEFDSFYGFGEKSGEFDKKEKFMGMSPKDAMGYNPRETDSLYKHIPFYIKLNHQTHKAVGYFYHNTAECDFDLGREKSNYWKRHSRYRTDAGDIDLFLINGPQVSAVVERYTDLTGKSCMLPRQAFGYLGSSMYYSELPQDCDKEIIGFADTTREEDFPLDGFQLSSGYCTADTDEGLKRCVFTWNKERFPDPREFFKQMNARGAVVSPNVKTGILLAHPEYPEMAAADIFVKDSVEDKPAVGTWWGGPGSFMDFTKESARKCGGLYFRALRAGSEP